MKIILTIAIAVLVSIVTLTASAQNDKKSEAARKDIAKDQGKLEQAQKDSVDDLRKFKKDAAEKIKKNEKSISQLKAKKINDNNDTKVKYDKKVAALEQKNNELRNKIDGCNEKEDSRLTTFKKEFNKEMDELGDSLDALLNGK